MPGPIDGQDPFRFEYDSSRLQLPPDATPMLHAHGLAVDDDSHILLSYQPNTSSADSSSSPSCLVRWRPDGTGGTVVRTSRHVCMGQPHSLRLAHEADGRSVLYHVNNGQSSGAAHLFKTTLDASTILWSMTGPPLHKESLPWLGGPTWLATPPNSPFIYLTDGYGTSRVHAYFASNGSYTGLSFGGKARGAGNAQPGLFFAAHSINWDRRKGELLVSDRGSNKHGHHRHQYVRILDQAKPDVRFTSAFTVPKLRLPCTFNVAPDGRHAVIPSLDGPVGIVDASNKLVSIVDVGKLLGASAGHYHPHDAQLLPSGDLIVATWNPGRLSWWRRLR